MLAILYGFGFEAVVPSDLSLQYFLKYFIL